MSLLLSRLSKLRGSHALVMRRSSCHLLLQSNDFSSSLPQKQTPPCQIVGIEFGGVKKKPLLGRLVIKNANDEVGTFVEVEKKVPPEVVYNDLHEEKMVTIGASHGWVATVTGEDGILRLQDDLIPVATKLPPKRIPLPPLVTLRHCQTQIVTNVSMTSSSPEEDEDCVVAVKLLGPQLSFCKPGIRNKAEWSNVKIENPSFYSSRVMYSKKDDMFHIPGCGGHVIGSWDLRKKHNPIIKIQELRFENLPELTKTTRDLLGSCYTSVYLVESPSTGETFMVKQYKKTTTTEETGVARMKTEFVMVFKLDDEGNKAVYTQDIGDLVIFISKSEPFCVPASSFPGLEPNIVHVMDYGEWVVVLLAGENYPNTVSRLEVKNLIPYYIPPQSTD